MKKIEAVFFDNDGVLVSTERLFCEANTKVLAEIFPEKNISHTTDDFYEYAVLTNLGSSGWLKKQGFSEEEIKTFRSHRDPLYTSLLNEQNYGVSGAREVLEILKRMKYRLMLTTSSLRKNFEHVHRNTGMRAFFEFEITREDTEKIKPDPEIYLKALEKSGLTKDQAVVIEDTPRGVSAGKNAGIFTIAIPHEFTKGLDFSKADVILDSIEELPEFLDTLKEHE